MDRPLEFRIQKDSAFVALRCGSPCLLKPIQIKFFLDGLPKQELKGKQSENDQSNILWKASFDIHYSC
jgi:hypothetical protein